MPMAPEDGSRASTKAMHRPLLKPSIKRILQLRVDNLCPCSHNTTPFWRPTSQPSNSRNQPRNHTAPQWAPVRLWHNRHLDSGNPSHEPCSTTPFSLQTSRPASSQIHHCNCRDLLASAAKSAALEAGWAAAGARSVGSRRGEYGSTTLSYLLPTCSLRRQRN